jgi:opacity protein-like surface antigen
LKAILAAAALAAFVASPALAADLIVEQDAGIIEAAPGDWSGFYAGAFGSYATGTATTEATVTDEIDLSGGLFGAAVGVNFQVDNFVLGIEGDLAWSGVEGSAVCALNPGFDCAGSIDWLSTVRGRAGVALDNVLLYATAGIAIAGGSATVTPAPALATGEFSDTFVGWTAGIGGEIKLTDTISARAEYAYTDLGHRTAPAGTLTTLGDTDITATLHSVKLGLNFAF